MSVELEKYWKPLIRFSLSLTGDFESAQDLAQETMVRALRSKQSDDSLKHAKTWLFTIALNTFRDQCRRNSRRPTHYPLLEAQVSNSWNPTLTLEQREEVESVLNYFQELPERQRQILYLRAVEEMSLPDIAEMLNTNVNNVKSQLSQARKKMRSHFENPSSLLSN